MKYQIGVAGLAVMGRGLALNLAEHGFAVAGYNRSSEPTEIFVEAGKAAGYTVTGCATLEEFCSVLEKPRKILLMVKAGAAVDAVLEGLMPYLEPGDIVIDGGNSHYPDTVRRHDACAQKNINFMGLGVSGGEEGARHGPALMPGGDKDAYAQVEKFLTTIAADDAAAGDVIECRVPRSMPEGCRVRVIRSQRAIDAASAALKRDVLRRRAVDVSVVARLGEPFAVTLTCCDDPSLTATATGFIVEAAKTRAVEASDLVEHVGRMGSSPFEAASFEVALDEGCGMGFSAVHKVRAAACKALEEAILAPYAERAKTLELPAIVTSDSRPAPEHYRDEPQICATVTSLEAAEAARAEGATRIYMTTDALDAAKLSPADTFEQGIVPVLDEVCRAVGHVRVDPWVVAGATVAIGNISELALAAQVGATAEIRSCLPVHNTPCMEALAERGAGAFWLSPEITLDEIVSLGAAAPAALGITVFGRPRVMTSEHCILQVANGCIHDCASCRLRARKLSLKNIDGKVMPVRTDIHGRSRLYDAYPIDLTPQVPQLLDAGVRRLMVDGTLLETDEVGRAVARVRRAVEAAQAGRKPAARLRGATSGCMFVGIS